MLYIPSENAGVDEVLLNLEQELESLRRADEDSLNAPGFEESLEEAFGSE